MPFNSISASLMVCGDSLNRYAILAIDDYI
jgi:hypothetical protein